MSNRWAVRRLATGTLYLVLAACGSTGSTAPQGLQASVPPASALSGCPPRMVQRPGSAVMVDYIDTIRFGGHDYVVQAAAPAGVRAGVSIGRIRCMITAYPVDPGYQLHDGDATRLPVGTPLFSVHQVSTTEALVAVVNGRNMLYTALP